MARFGEPIDIQQFAADLMSLSSFDIEELTKELKEKVEKAQNAEEAKKILEEADVQ